MEKTKEQLEKEKIQAEIDEIKKPFYKKLTFLSIISSSLFAAITIFVTILISNSEKLKTLEKRELDIRTKELKIREDSLNNSLANLERQIANLNKEYQLKESSLQKNIDLKSDSLNTLYFTRLKQLQYELTFIERYMEKYAKGYSQSFVFKNRATQDTVRKYVPNGQKQFAEWLQRSIFQAIKESNSRNLQQVNLKVDVEEFKIKK